MKKNLTLFLCLLVGIGAANAQFQRIPVDPAVAAVHKVDLKHVKVATGTVSLSQEMPGPGPTDVVPNGSREFTPNPEFGKIDPKVRRLTEEKLRNLKPFYPDEPVLESPTVANPTIGTEFQANVYDGWRPPDNTVAVSDDYFIVSCTNSHIYYYNTGGTQLYSASYGTFFGNSSYILYDPRVIYDPVYNRFIMVVLQGNTPSYTKVKLCYSKSSDPRDGWWVYTLDGDVGGNNNWFDYPHLAISNNEVFITGNLFNSNDDFQYSVIFQVEKVDGYNGNNISWTSWYNITNAPFSLVPASYGQNGSYGPGIYLVSSDENGTSQDKFRLYEITDSRGNSPSLNAYSVDGGFETTGNAPQNGTSVLLDNGGTRIRSAFYLNGVVHFTLSQEFNATGYNGIQYSRLNVSSLNLDTYGFGLDGYDYSYPSLASYGTSYTDKSVMICFLRSGSTIYPEIRVVECDNDGTWSGSVQVKAGESYIAVNPDNGVERWGDYSCIARRYNNSVPEVWLSGCFGETNHTYGTWIAQVTTCDVPAQPSVISGDATPCKNSTGNVYSVTNVAGTTYTWVYDGTGETITAGQGTSSITVSYSSSPTIGTWTVTPHNSCGNGVERTKSITSFTSVPSQPSVISGDASPCRNTTGNVYSVTMVLGVTYTWSYSGLGETITAGQGTSSITVSYGGHATSGSWTVTPENGCGNGTSRILAVTMYGVPLQPSAITGSSTLCQGTTGTGYSVTNVAGTTYTWTYSGTGLTITSGQGTSSIVVNYSASATSGTLTVTPGNGCGSGTTSTLVVSVIPTLNTVATTVVPGGQSVCYNACQTVTLGGGGRTFTVANGGDATVVAGAAIAMLPGATVQSGGHFLGYIAPTGPWCSQLGLLPGQNVSPEPEESPVSAIPDNGKDNLFRIYPNPTTGNFRLELSEEPAGSADMVRIYDMTGAMVLEKSITSGRLHDLSLENRQAGIYVVSVIHQGKAGTKKLIKH